MDKIANVQRHMVALNATTVALGHADVTKNFIWNASNVMGVECAAPKPAHVATSLYCWIIDYSGRSPSWTVLIGMLPAMAHGLMDHGGSCQAAVTYATLAKG